MKLQKLTLGLLAAMATFVSCTDDNEIEAPELNVPSSYEFSRDAKNTVSYGGQKTRIDMHSQLKSAVSAASKTTVSAQSLNSIFNHQENNTDFEAGVYYDAATLNASSKNISGATAYSVAYSDEVKVVFNDWFTELATLSQTRPDAASGVAGIAQRKADGSKPILIDANGLEYTQLVSKSLMGAMELDQIVNKYLTAAKLNVENGTNKEGKDYTSMEHHWDEAFGYVNLHPNALAYDSLDDVPAADLDGVDRFWGEYIYSVDGYTAGNGIKTTLMNAFLKGRAAVAAKQYDVRDQQAEIIKKAMSLVCAVKAVNYLEKGKATVLSDNVNDKANAYHALSEAYGFIFGLQFSNNGTDTPYFSKAEVATMLEVFDTNGGLYAADIESKVATLSQQIGTKFGFAPSDAK